MSKLIGVVDEDLPRLIDGLLKELGWGVKDRQRYWIARQIR
jgi:hypothetical protein